MKKLTKNILNAINLDVPTLTEDSEGKLYGGFSDFEYPIVFPKTGVNSFCGNAACRNIPCTNSCPNLNCPTTTTTQAPGGNGNIGLLI